jgi:HlyD family secretion protein
MDRKIDKKKFRFKKLWPWLLILAAGLALGVAYGFPDMQQSTLQVQRDRLTISTVRQGPFQEYVPVSGTVIPIKTVYLDVIEGGYVEAVYHDAGSVVQEGEPLLKLANTNLLLDVMNREAEVFQQQNNVNNARLLIEQTRHAFAAALL